MNNLKTAELNQMPTSNIFQYIKNKAQNKFKPFHRTYKKKGKEERASTHISIVRTQNLFVGESLVVQRNWRGYMLAGLMYVVLKPDKYANQDYNNIYASNKGK